MESKQRHKLHPVAQELGLTSDRFEHFNLSESAEHYINKTKKKERSYMQPEEWYKEGFAKGDLEGWLRKCPDEIERVDCEDLSPQDFIERYESKNLPVVIKGLTKNWNVDKYWTFEEVYQRYKNVKLKVGEDDEGYPMRIKLKYFFEYLVNQTDDSPLYLFESALEDRKEAKDMIRHFEVPKYFKDDLFSIMGEKRRPPFRWFLIGPRRSGSTLHIDPLETSAWNSSLQGQKRWVLFPPETSKQIAKGKEFLGSRQEYEAVTYFAHLLPQVKQKYHGHIKTIEFIQNPGETVYVPGGWWHAVVNVNNTMAVTQNFVSYTNFEKVWASLREERKKFSCKFLKGLQEEHPSLYEKAIMMNQRDNFVMYDQRKPKLKRESESELKDEVKKKRKDEKNSGRSESTSSSSSSSSSESKSQP